jgi:hypothetical protein
MSPVTFKLIALDHINQLNLLEDLFSSIVIPPAVVKEIGPLSLPSWIIKENLNQPIAARILQSPLGAGESEAISLALETNARFVLLDDRPARRLAQALGLQVIGTLGILLAAKRKALLPAVRPCLEALSKFNFRIAADLFERVLKDAGEDIT